MYTDKAMKANTKALFRRAGAVVAGAAFISFFLHTCGQGSTTPLSSLVPGWLADAAALIFLTAFIAGLPIFGINMIRNKNTSDRFGSIVIGLAALVIWSAALAPVVYALWLQ